jgi:hypothetical protein
VERNPAVQPMVRAYDSVVVVADERVAPELAVALSPKHFGVISGGAELARSLAAVDPGTVGPDACAAGRGPNAAPDLRGEVAMACAAHQWIGIYPGIRTVPVGEVGGVFTAPLDGLQGVNVWLDRPPVATEFALQTVGADGSLGPEVARSTGVGNGGDDMTTFSFAPIEASAGKRYAFTLSCTRCAPGSEPRMVVANAERGPGDFLEGGTVDRNQVAAFSLVYIGAAPASPSDTRIGASTYDSGSWRIETSGTRASVVVVAAAWFPGWEARVDGKRAPVLIADGAFLGVAVPAGDHHITLVYKKPRVAALGLVITAGTLLGVVLFLFTDRRRRRRQSDVSATPADSGAGGGSAARRRPRSPRG